MFEAPEIRGRTFPMVTLGLIALNVVAFLMEAVLPDEMLRAFLDALSCGPRNYYNPFSYITYLFFHGKFVYPYFPVTLLKDSANYSHQCGLSGSVWTK